MILTGKAIASLDGAIVPIKGKVNPASINLTLGPRIGKVLPNRSLYYPVNDVNNNWAIDPKLPQEVEWHEINGSICLLPGELYLAECNELVTMGDYCGFIDGRSSIGRMGVFVHVTAGLIDPGYCGKITLEIMVVKPTILYLDMEICQIRFMETTGEKTYYKGKYQGDTTATESRIDREFK